MPKAAAASPLILREQEDYHQAASGITLTLAEAHKITLMQALADRAAAVLLAYMAQDSLGVSRDMPRQKAALAAVPATMAQSVATLVQGQVPQMAEMEERHKTQRQADLAELEDR